MCTGAGPIVAVAEGGACWAGNKAAIRRIKADARTRVFSPPPRKVAISNGRLPHQLSHTSLATRTASTTAQPMLASYSRCFR